MSERKRPTDRETQRHREIDAWSQRERERDIHTKMTHTQNLGF